MNILLFEDWGNKFFELGPDPKKQGLKLYTYKYTNDIKEGDRIYHNNSGKGTVLKIYHDHRNPTQKLINIKFDERENDIQIFLLNVFINHIKRIEEEQSEINFGGKIKKDEFENNKKDKSEENDEIEEEEEEEEEYVDTDDGDDFLEDLTEEELSIMTIEEFFNDQELQLLVSLNDIKKYRKKLKNYSNINPIKDEIYKRRLETTFILEKYFKYLKNKFPDLNIYKFNGQIPYEELFEIRKKDRLKLPDNILNKYGYATGVLFYWVFNNAVIFKTI